MLCPQVRQHILAYSHKHSPIPQKLYVQYPPSLNFKPTSDAIVDASNTLGLCEFCLTPSGLVISLSLEGSHMDSILFGFVCQPGRKTNDVSEFLPAVSQNEYM